MRSASGRNAMNRQPLEYPENTAEYQDGIEAKQLGLTERACPW